MPQSLFDGQSTRAASLPGLIEIAPGGIVSKPLLDTDVLKQVLFAIDAGQSLSEHAAPFLATVHVLEGAVCFRVEQREHELRAHDWLIMPPDARHAAEAREPTRMLLTLIKGAHR